MHNSWALRSMRGSSADYSAKRNKQFFATRLKGSILKYCSRPYATKCSYSEFTGALQALKAVIISSEEKKDLRMIFRQNNDYISINALVDSLIQEEANTNSEFQVKVDIAHLQDILQQESKIEQKSLSTTTTQSAEEKQDLENYLNATPKPQDSSLFRTVNSTLSNEFKGTRLPRPRNVRNEINMRPFSQTGNIYLTNCDARSEKQEHSLLDKIKMSHIGFHHMQTLERLLGELDPNHQGIANRDQFLRVVKTHMCKIFSEELIQDIINFISDDNKISCSKLSELLDAYKFAPRYPVKGGKNNSDNFKSKMLSQEISVPKMSNVQELYITLIEKLEEKFEKFLKAFKFFDAECIGAVHFTSFKQTLDKLSLRCTDSEVKELFQILDTKKDGYLDYEEFCALVPNKLELEMLERNGEALSNKMSQLQEKFGDLDNFTPDPFRVFERSRYKDTKFLDETIEKIGSEVFYSDKLKNTIDSNLILRKRHDEMGLPMKYGFNLPSDKNQQFAYGKKSSNGESMHDVMQNNFGKEWILDLEAKRAKEKHNAMVSKYKHRRRNSFANQLRTLYNNQENQGNTSQQYSTAQKMKTASARCSPDSKRKRYDSSEKTIFGNTLSQIRHQSSALLAEREAQSEQLTKNVQFQNKLAMDSPGELQRPGSSIGQVLREIKIPMQNNFMGQNNTRAKTLHDIGQNQTNRLKTIL